MAKQRAVLTPMPRRISALIVREFALAEVYLPRQGVLLSRQLSHPHRRLHRCKGVSEEELATVMFVLAYDPS